MKRIIIISWLICSAGAFTVHLHHDRKLYRTVLCKATSSYSTTTTPSGLYRSFVDHAWNKLHESGILIHPTSDASLISPDLMTNTAAAKGMPEGTIVKISVAASRGNSSTPIHYGRYALLETLLPEADRTTDGIQVLNMVIFGKPPLPVWGVDLVSLPGGRHLLAVDVQPMIPASTTSATLEESAISSSGKELDKWKAWHQTHVQETFEWGGDLPEDALKFFSPYALWTRLSGEKAVETIETSVFDAFCSHLDLYLELVDSFGKAGSPACVDDHQAEYLDYRVKNDPARPMLRSLYGPEWTERVLYEVLFNKELALP